MGQWTSSRICWQISKSYKKFPRLVYCFNFNLFNNTAFVSWLITEERDMSSTGSLIWKSSQSKNPHSKIRQPVMIVFSHGYYDWSMNLLPEWQRERSSLRVRPSVALWCISKWWHGARKWISEMLTLGAKLWEIAKI